MTNADMIGGRIIPTRPYYLTLGTLYMPFSAPTGPRGGTYPASTIIHHCSPIEGDGGCRCSRVNELAPGRIPGLTADLRWLLTENQAHQVKMVDGHIHEQRLPDLVIAMISSFKAIPVAPEVDSDRANRSQFPLANQRGNGLNGRKEPIILAYHQHAISLCSHFDHLLRLDERGSKWLFK